MPKFRVKNMKSLSLYCKSYRTDLLRLQRLANSIQQFNQENIPFYVSVPESDVKLFKEFLTDYDLEIISDEQILACTKYSKNSVLEKLTGNIKQQIVKSEYWRLGISSSYVCLDSDAQFIRPFTYSDFLWSAKNPYTVIDEAHAFLETCIISKKKYVLDSYKKEAFCIQSEINRTGRSYSFGPFPVVWHRDVWDSLEKEYLSYKNMNFMDAILKFPIESRWYGEALLQYQAIRLMPCQPLFKVYHYAWQLDQERTKGVDLKQLTDLYCGVIYQSSWERELDWPKEGGSWSSRLARRLRRSLGRV
jgi:hypothetical protein